MRIPTEARAQGGVVILLGVLEQFVLVVFVGAEHLGVVGADIICRFELISELLSRGWRLRLNPTHIILPRCL
jgi:hypothetical protein